ncbi:MAG: hypothetical protein FVQ84_00015 [Planctomycetes bacterium]|nr:hypothetical protein [Planctomycetota bacterium]
MNKKQIICLWLGIAVFVFAGLVTLYEPIYLWKGFGREPGGGDLMLPRFIVLWVCIIVVTIGLIYTFRDKQDKKDKDV